MVNAWLGGPGSRKGGSAPPYTKSMHPSRRNALIALACLIILPIATVAVSPLLPDGFAWRARVIRAKVLGQLPELPFLDMIKWMAPRSPVYLGALAETPNVRSGILNPISAREPT